MMAIEVMGGKEMSVTVSDGSMETADLVARFKRVMSVICCAWN